MNAPNPKMLAVRRAIRQLDEAASNRIAAGEVVERPASAVKELVENALDAGARTVDVTIAQAGKSLIRVTDDGHGIPAEELPLALSRHATSKLEGDDLLDIRFLGFRGEALPALGAVGRLTVTSRAAGASEAASISGDGGIVAPVRPAALGKGTVVELRDLFWATPARLKFLRSDRAETQAISEVMRRLAMAAPDVAFRLTDATDPARCRVLLDLDPEPGDMIPALSRRLRRLLGPEFAEAAIAIDAERDAATLAGYAALPTHSRGAAVDQYVFVNARTVRDRLLHGALRAAYGDLMPRDRHPAAVLFLRVPPSLVDVNVHPAKAEVRFRDPAFVRGFLVGAVRQAVAGAGHRALGPVASGVPMRAFRPSPAHARAAVEAQAPPGFAEALPGLAAWSGRVESATDLERPEPEVWQTEHPLGIPRAQLLDTYILSQTAEGIALIDAHAAHERLVYERLKARLAAGERVPSQLLLLPEIVELDGAAASRLHEAADALSRLGLVFEPFGQATICLRETPALLGEIDGAALLRDVADVLAEGGDPLGPRLDAILSRMACHGSVRAGRRLGAAEMAALLREMEREPASLTCNHGRPTVLHLARSDIERMFGRR
jgi:DNA mismatch repair protein MutL